MIVVRACWWSGDDAAPEVMMLSKGAAQDSIVALMNVWLSRVSPTTGALVNNGRALCS
jgi:hypothetical protein